MIGDDRVRHCAQCDLDVFNLTSMTRAEAESLIASANEGRVCVRLFRRSDGTVLTRDCAVGVKAKRRLPMIAASIAGVGAMVSAAAMVASAMTADDAPEVGRSIHRDPAERRAEGARDRRFGALVHPLDAPAQVAIDRENAERTRREIEAAKREEERLERAGRGVMLAGAVPAPIAPPRVMMGKVKSPY
jgi:hypothetical protein